MHTTSHAITTCLQDPDDIYLHVADTSFNRIDRWDSVVVFLDDINKSLSGSLPSYVIYLVDEKLNVGVAI